MLKSTHSDKTKKKRSKKKNHFWLLSLSTYSEDLVPQVKQGKWTEGGDNLQKRICAQENCIVIDCKDICAPPHNVCSAHYVWRRGNWNDFSQKIAPGKERSQIVDIDLYCLYSLLHWTIHLDTVKIAPWKVCMNVVLQCIRQ